MTQRGDVTSPISHSISRVDKHSGLPTQFPTICCSQYIKVSSQGPSLNAIKIPSPSLDLISIPILPNPFSY